MDAEHGGPENRCYMTETRAFGFSVLLGSIICNRETVGKKTCAIKKVAAFAFEAVNDSMVRRCSNEQRAYKGRGSFGGWNRGVFRSAFIRSDRLDTLDRLGRLDKLYIFDRFERLDRLNSLDKLGRLDSLDRSNRLD